MNLSLPPFANGDFAENIANLWAITSPKAVGTYDGLGTKGELTIAAIPLLNLHLVVGFEFINNGSGVIVGTTNPYPYSGILLGQDVDGGIAASGFGVASAPTQAGFGVLRQAICRAASAAFLQTIANNHLYLNCVATFDVVQNGAAWDIQVRLQNPDAGIDDTETFTAVLNGETNCRLFLETPADTDVGPPNSSYLQINSLVINGVASYPGGQSHRIGLNSMERFGLGAGRMR